MDQDELIAKIDADLISMRDDPDPVCDAAFRRINDWLRDETTRELTVARIKLLWPTYESVIAGRDR